MTAFAHIRADKLGRFLDVFVARGLPGGVRCLQIESASRNILEHEVEPTHPLRLEEDEARALYEALADHFGHTGHDIRALRRDYDAERRRVDLLIGGLLK